VDDIDEAIDFSSEQGTDHSDGILTRSDEDARRFVTEVSLPAVFINASTRFTDGSQLKLGAEGAFCTQACILATE
jgi:glutamate-5-semialdehyde dehydrogenase